jgi:hypothetical protein
MSTTVLAYLILFMGFITFLVGAFGVLMLIFEEVAKTERVPFRYYAMVVGLISGGVCAENLVRFDLMTESLKRRPRWSRCYASC